MKTLHMTVILTALLASAAFASDGAWLTDFEQAKKESAKRNVPILADFSGSDWCGWCIRLDKEVFSTKAFKEYAKKSLVLFVADFPRGKDQPKKLAAQNSGLAATYAVQGFPTVLLLDAKGRELARTGYRRGGVDSYVEHLSELVSRTR